MSVVTEVSLQKNKSRANIFLDGEFVCGLDTLIIVKNSIKVGIEISKEKLIALQQQSDAEGAYQKALTLLSKQRYTCVAIAKKLKEKGYNGEIINNVIEKLKEYRYLSDVDFAREYINCNKNRSKKDLQCKLMQKGVCSADVNAVLKESFNEEDEQAKCDLLAEKFLRGKDKTLPNLKNKLIAHLTYKGFSFNFCLNSANKLMGETFDD